MSHENSALETIGTKGKFLAGLFPLLASLGEAPVPIATFEKIYVLLLDKAPNKTYLIFGYGLMSVIESIVDYNHNQTLIKNIHLKIQNANTYEDIVKIFLQELRLLLKNHTDKLIVTVLAGIALAFIVMNGAENFYRNTFSLTTGVDICAKFVAAIASAQFISTTMQAFIHDNDSSDMNNPYLITIKTPFKKHPFFNLATIIGNLITAILINSPGIAVFLGAAIFSYVDSVEVFLKKNDSLLNSIGQSLFIFIAAIYGYAKYKTTGVLATRAIINMLTNRISFQQYHSAKDGLFLLTKLTISMIAAGFFLTQYTYGALVLSELNNNENESDLTLPPIKLFLSMCLLGMGHAFSEQIVSTNPFFQMIGLSRTSSPKRELYIDLGKQEEESTKIANQHNQTEIKEVILTLLFASLLPLILEISEDKNTQLIAGLTAFSVSSTYTLFRILLFFLLEDKLLALNDNEKNNIDTYKFDITEQHSERLFFLKKETLLWGISTLFIYCTIDFFMEWSGDHSNHNESNGHLNAGFTAMLGMLALISYLRIFFSTAAVVHKHQRSGLGFFDSLKHTTWLELKFLGFSPSSD